MATKTTNKINVRTVKMNGIRLELNTNKEFPNQPDISVKLPNGVHINMHINGLRDNQPSITLYPLDVDAMEITVVGFKPSDDEPMFRSYLSYYGTTETATVFKPNGEPKPEIFPMPDYDAIADGDF